MYMLARDVAQQVIRLFEVQITTRFGFSAVINNRRVGQDVDFSSFKFGKDGSSIATLSGMHMTDVFLNR